MVVGVGMGETQAGASNMCRGIESKVKQGQTQWRGHGQAQVCQEGE